MEYPSIAPSIPLAGGTSIPAVGLGVFRSACGTETEQAVTWALEAGYRHIDTARSYGNEDSVGRAIARSANTGTSGFIDTRGDVQQKLGWDRRGILTGEVELNSELTFYTRYGDYLGRISELLMGLCILYYIAYRIKKKNHLVK